MKLDSILDSEINDNMKGVPGGTPPFPLKEIHGKNWNVLNEDLPFPLMVLKESQMRKNLSHFQMYLEENDISLSPHGKTTMSPQLFSLQMEYGAWAISAATINQMQVYRNTGVQRIILVNQLIGKQNVRYVVDELNRDSEFEFYCLMDSAKQAELVANYARQFGLKRKINILIEIGIMGGRTGCRTPDAAHEVLTSIKANSDILRLAGIEGYEGIIAGKTEESLAKVDACLTTIKSFLEQLQPEDFSEVDEIILTAGGSAYFDRVTEIFKSVQFDKKVRIVIRSGCYITHDHGVYELFQKFAKDGGRKWTKNLEPSLEIFSYVQSIPEKGLAFLTMGKRDCPYDAGLPTPIKRYRESADGRKEVAPLKHSSVEATNDQHAYLHFDGDDLQVGDIVVCGISHPCTAFDKWQVLMIVDDDYQVTNAIRTYF